MALGSAWLVSVTGKGISFQVIGALGVLIFGYMVWSYAWEFLHTLTFSLELGDDWISTRDFQTFIVIPYDKIHSFEENAIFEGGRLGGYRFQVVAIDGRIVPFSTQVVGWAQIIRMLHEMAPEKVPSHRETEAFRMIGSVDLPSEAGVFTAPGETSKAAWSKAGVTRWYDYVFGWFIAISTIFLPGLWATKKLKAHGFPDPLVGIVFIAAFTLVSPGVVSFCVRQISRIRSRLTRQTSSLEHGRN